MGFIHNYKEKKQQVKEKKLIYNDTLKSGGLTIAYDEGKYLGGHPDIIGEKEGDITVKSTGVFFNDTQNFNFIFFPIEKLLKSEFLTGEQISKNEAFSRILAFSGFSFAFKRKTREKHMYLTINYLLNDVECQVLFETKSANRLASAIAKIVQEYVTNNKVDTRLSVYARMKELSELKALGILTEEDFNEKKRELLSKI
ncbi:MAG: hypothetical protein K0S01_842 [Herbinix sp.]|jgi:hypothetical protein|nr:hypothetical protein [Herbinix sp.]